MFANASESDLARHARLTRQVERDFSAFLPTPRRAEAEALLVLMNELHALEDQLEKVGQLVLAGPPEKIDQHKQYRGVLIEGMRAFVADGDVEAFMVKILSLAMTPEQARTTAKLARISLEGPRS